MQKTTTYLKATLLAITLVLGSAYVSAWTAPVSDPPGGSVALPVNTGNTDQIKTGSFTAWNINAGRYLKVGGYGDSIGKSTTCTVLDEGSIRYNRDTKIMQFCNGLIWVDMSTIVKASAVPTTETKTLDYYPDTNAYSLNTTGSFSKAKIISASAMADGASIVNTTIPNDGKRRTIWNYPCDGGNWLQIQYSDKKLFIWSRGDEDCNYTWRHSKQYITVEFSS